MACFFPSLGGKLPMPPVVLAPAAPAYPGGPVAWPDMIMVAASEYSTKLIFKISSYREKAKSSSSLSLVYLSRLLRPLNSSYSRKTP